MKKINWAILISLTLLSMSLITYQVLIDYVDFDESMKKNEYMHIVKQNNFFERTYNLLKQLYEKNNPQKIKQNNTIRIPKIIHQIWLGSPFPEKYKQWQASWKEKHSDWDYKLWTDADVATFNFINKKLFDAATNYGEKSDIWRYEILEQYGGVYVDTDFECLKALDILHYMYDFYIGIQPLDTNIVQLGIGIIGSIPHHPLLKQAIKQLPVYQSKKQIILKTGPIFFTNIFLNYMNRFDYLDIALPATYFYPLGYIKKDDGWQKSESFAVHHWEGSWLK
ncbi:MAG: glycosyltransferase [Candidatus Babeliales bacterium]